MVVQKAPSLGTNTNLVASQYLNTQKLVGDRLWAWTDGMHSHDHGRGGLRLTVSYFVT